MEDLFVVRRIDNLGRIVIPKAVRQKMQIEEGDPLEMLMDNNGNLIMRKYVSEQ